MDKRKNGKKSGTENKEDAIALLTADHRKVRKLFKEAEEMEADDPELEEIVRQACTEIEIHAKIEEEIVYPALREALSDEELVPEAEVEHDCAKDLIAKLEELDPSDEMFKATFTVLGEYVTHHIKEEESEIFPQAKKAKVDTKELGLQILERKEELMEEMGIADEDEEEEESDEDEEKPAPARGGSKALSQGRR